MSFTHEQVKILIKRLDDYRARERRGRRLLSIAKLLVKLNSFAMETEMVAPGTKLDLDDEALRRFCKGETNPEWDTKFEIIKAFLIDEGIMTEEELKNDGEVEAELYAVFGYLANTSPEAMRLMEQLDNLAATNALENSTCEIKLTFTLDPRKIHFRAVENYSQYATGEHVPAIFRRDGAQMRKGVKKGYGFLSTDQKLLHVFLKGGGGRERVHYVQVDVKKDSQHLYLIRAGGGPLSTVEGPARVPSLEECNILRFTPEGRAQTQSITLPRAEKRADISIG